MKVCIVTPDLIGPVKNGGIGTCCAALAHGLSASGSRVTVLFTQCGSQATLEDDWVRGYTSAGIEIAIGERLASRIFPAHCSPAHPALRMAATVYDWLKGEAFDAIVFMDWQGHGFYAIQAKRGGLHFRSTALITHVHSPTLWHEVNNAHVSPDPRAALTRFMERKCIEMADALVSPSAYMFEWLGRHGFKPEGLKFVIPNPIRISKARARRRSRHAIREIVFFGRLEYRKGIAQFCDALDQLNQSGPLPQRVTFLGKFGYVGTEHAATYIGRRARQWKFSVRILANLDSRASVAYLERPGILAVMPSIAENSPFTVYECLVACIPFLARDVGGTAELIAEADRPKCLFSANPASLAERLASNMRDGAAIAHLAFEPDLPLKQWRHLLSQLNTSETASNSHRVRARRRQTAPLVSVCLTHFNRPKYLRQAVQSLVRQEFTEFEVILIDDGSDNRQSHRVLDTLEPEFAARAWRIIRTPNQYLGKARNTAARFARGKYLLFMDDDNVARPEMIGRFVTAAETSGADLITSMFDVFSGNKEPTERTPVVERYMPVGGAVAYSVVGNAIGDANALVRRQVFKELGGFTEDYGLGHEDFEFFLRATLSRKSIVVVPEALFWYRRNSTSMLQRTPRAANAIRSLRPFLEMLPVDISELAVLAYGGLATPDDPASKDPESPEILSAIARDLSVAGQSALAIQILDAMNGGANQPEVLELIEAAKHQDLGKVLKILKQLPLTIGMDEVTVSSTLLLLAPLLRPPNGSPPRGAIDLAEHMAALIPESLQVRLLVSELHLRAGDLRKGEGHLQSALDAADREYLRRRPDVADAVRLGAFKDAISHYARHGIREHVRWPEQEYFLAIFSVLARRCQEDGREISVALHRAQSALQGPPEHPEVSRLF